MKPVMFSDDVVAGLRDWQNTAKRNARGGRPSPSVTPVSSRPTSPLRGSVSPAYLRRKSNEEWGGAGEVTSASPSRHRNVGNLNGKDRLSETSIVEIDRDAENRSSIELSYKSQQEADISSRDFSFAGKDSPTASK